MPSGMAEAARTALAGREFGDDGELGPDDWHDHHLRDALADGDGERRLAPVPARHQQFALIVAVDQADQIAQNDTVLVTKARARQHHRGQFGVADVDSEAGGDQMCLARLHRQRFRQTGAQVQAGRADSSVVGEGDVLTQTRVENFQFNGLGGHAVSGSVLLIKFQLSEFWREMVTAMSRVITLPKLARRCCDCTQKMKKNA